MAGFVGSNVLRGDTRIMHGEDLKLPRDDLTVVDLRSVAEYARGHLVGAINLPVDDLRGAYKLLDKNKQCLVYCQVGYRGYLAACILAQKGFDVFNLDGGFKSIVEAGLKHIQSE